MGKSSSQITGLRSPSLPEMPYLRIPAVLSDFLGTACQKHGWGTNAAALFPSPEAGLVSQWHFCSWRSERFILKTTTRAHNLYWSPKEVYTKIGLKHFLFRKC